MITATRKAQLFGIAENLSRDGMIETADDIAAAVDRIVDGGPVSCAYVDPTQTPGEWIDGSVSAPTAEEAPILREMIAQLVA